MTAPYSVDAVPHERLEALAALAPAAGPAKAAPPPRPSGGAGDAPPGGYTSRLLVAKWLDDKGVDYRVKDRPDGRGRTVYVLARCPFDPSHADPDACVMQAPDGMMSAQCFHNGCAGLGWQDFKHALGAPNRQHYDPPLKRPRPENRRKRKGKGRPADAAPRGPRGAGPHEAGAPVQGPPSGGPPGEGPPEGAAAPEGNAASDLPWVQGNRRQLRDVTADALAAVLAGNDPPAVFQRGGLLTRLRPRDGGAAALGPLTDAALRGVLARVASWTKVRSTNDGDVLEEAPPPLDVVKDLASLPAWGGIPPLDAVVECPVFAAGGALVLAPGYHPAARLWHQPAVGLEVAVPDAPTGEDVRRARELLTADLLGDFPFADDASKAHALAALLLPFVRPLIDGPTPLHLLDAPVEGTGKTLLATAIGLVATGREPEAMAEASCDEEWRKRITASLAEAPTFVLLDNLNRTLDSGALASALTCRTWKDRILGVSKTASLPVSCVWLASGNNTRLSRELARRTLWCRLDARVDAPWERKHFRHPHLVRWAKASRGALVGAALTLCRAWLAAGRPPGRETLGMFEAWAEVVGGILEVAGVPGLLANAAELRATRADQVAEWRAFVTAWWQELGEKVVGVEELFRLATTQKLLDSVLGDKGEKSQRTRLGLALGKAADRVFGGRRLERAGEDHKGRQQFRLRPAAPAAAGPEDGPGGAQRRWEA